jgi:hypothetical protein
MPTEFFTIDPGLKASGWARWKLGCLIGCGLLRAPSSSKSLCARIEAQMEAFHAMSDGHAVVAERMKHYPKRRGAPYIDPNDLIDLSVLSGRLGNAWVYATEWKGAVPRDVEQDRSRAALAPNELAMVEAVLPASLRKEAWSAVGIGLSILKRTHLKCGWSFV